MKKIIMSVFAIAVMATVAGVGSYALWTDHEESLGNTVVAGSLDLVMSLDNGVTWLDDDDLAGIPLIPVTVGPDGVYPGATNNNDPITFRVKNQGTVAGTLKFTIPSSSISDNENTLIEPEEDMGDTGGGTGNGELCNNVKLTIKYGGVTYVTDKAINDPSLTSGISLDTDMTAGEWHTVEVVYSVDSNADNTIMTDSCVFGVTADLTQN